MLRVIPPRNSRIQPVGALSFGKVQPRLGLIQTNHGAINLLLVRSQKTRHAEGAFEFGIEPILLLPRGVASAACLDELTVTDGEFLVGSLEVGSHGSILVLEFGELGFLGGLEFQFLLASEFDGLELAFGFELLLFEDGDVLENCEE